MEVDAPKRFRMRGKRGHFDQTLHGYNPDAVRAVPGAITKNRPATKAKAPREELPKFRLSSKTDANVAQVIGFPPPPKAAPKAAPKARAKEPKLVSPEAVAKAEASRARALAARKAREERAKKAKEVAMNAAAAAKARVEAKVSTERSLKKEANDKRLAMGVDTIQLRDAAFLGESIRETAIKAGAHGDLALSLAGNVASRALGKKPIDPSELMKAIDKVQRNEAMSIRSSGTSKTGSTLR